MTVSWVVPPEEAFGELADAYIRAIQDAVWRLAQRRAPEIEIWMKANAPWTDRTGNARQGLAADAERLANLAVEIILSYNVDYGLFLELAHAGNYAIIAPALDQWAPVLWQDVLSILSIGQFP